MKTLIGQQQVKLLLMVGKYLADGGNVARTVLFNELGMTRSDLTKATTMNLFANAVKDCDTVVQALQVCGSERDRLRDKANKANKAKPITAKDLEAKRLKDLKENAEYNSHKAMIDL